MRDRAGILLLIILLLHLQSATAVEGLESQISSSCPGNYEPVLSLSSTDKNGHPGHPATYGNNLCIKGLVDSNIQSGRCDEQTGFYLSSNDTNAHLSKFSDYNLRVCTSDMRTVMRDSCLSNETALLSVSDTHNAHAADPGFWTNPKGKEVCGFIIKEAQNFTVKLEFNHSSSDEVYFDDSEVNDESSFSLAEFPYIVSTDSDHVSGIVSSTFISAERSLENENEIKMKKDFPGSVMVPYTGGDHRVIEDDEDLVLENEFLGQISPSFGFFTPEEPLVKIILQPDVDIISTVKLATGSHTLEIEKTGEKEIEVRKVE